MAVPLIVSACDRGTSVPAIAQEIVTGFPSVMGGATREAMRNGSWSATVAAPFREHPSGVRTTTAMDAADTAPTAKVMRFVPSPLVIAAPSAIHEYVAPGIASTIAPDVPNRHADAGVRMGIGRQAASGATLWVWTRPTRSCASLSGDGSSVERRVVTMSAVELSTRTRPDSSRSMILPGWIDSESPSEER